MRSCAEYVALICISGLASCAPRMALDPAGKGAVRPNISVGGPMVSAFGTYVPIPNLALGARYGITSNTDLGANVYVLPMAFQMGAIDAGAIWYFGVGENVKLALEPRCLVFISLKPGVSHSPLVYPAMLATMSEPLGSGRGYFGLDVVPLLYGSDFDLDPPAMAVSASIGYRWELGAGYRLTTEVKWIGFNIRTDATVEYVHPLRYGAIAPLIGLEFPW